MWVSEHLDEKELSFVDCLQSAGSFVSPDSILSEILEMVMVISSYFTDEATV